MIDIAAQASANSIWVFSPAGLCSHSRSIPIAAPAARADAKRTMISIQPKCESVSIGKLYRRSSGRLNTGEQTFLSPNGAAREHPVPGETQQKRNDNTQIGIGPGSRCAAQSEEREEIALPGEPW